MKQRVYFDRLQQQGDHGKQPDCTTGPFPLVKMGSTMPLNIDVHLIHPLFKHCKQIPKKFYVSYSEAESLFWPFAAAGGSWGTPDRITGPFPLVKLGSTMPLKIDVHLIHPLFKHCKQIPK